MGGGESYFSPLFFFPCCCCRLFRIPDGASVPQTAGAVSLQRSSERLKAACLPWVVGISKDVPWGVEPRAVSAATERAGAGVFFEGFNPVRSDVLSSWSWLWCNFVSYRILSHRILSYLIPAALFTCFGSVFVSVFVRSHENKACIPTRLLPPPPPPPSRPRSRPCLVLGRGRAMDTNQITCHFF